MLAVQVSPRKKVYVTFLEDTFPNKGGYYCQVYGDEMLNCEYEGYDFTISRGELSNTHNADDRLRKAYIIANYRVKSMF